MQKKNLLIVLLFFSALTFAQNEASYWYFGERAGLRFEANTNSVTVLNDGELNTREGCASISDGNGDLLFYTDGSFVWDRNGNLMPNGTGLFGDPSSTQSAIIIPKPQDDTIYYIFTVDTSVFQNDPDFGFNYSEVDMTLNGGLGDVIASTKNTLLLQDSSEKISAVLKDCQTEHIYVITLASQNGNPSSPFTHFHIFEVTTNGINTLTPQNIGTIINDPRGYLKFSPDGTKLVSANMASGLFLYDFDVSTGIISNPIQLQSPVNINRAYGVEFSQSNQFLYVNFSNDLNGQGSNVPSNHNTALVQYNLNASALNNFEPIVINEELANYRGALQLAIDGKIYRALSNTYNSGKPSLGVINNPNSLGLACNYDPNGISLSPNNSSQGLPPFIQSLFNSQIDIIRNGISATELRLCTGDSYTLQANDIAGADYIWSFNGNPLTETSSQLFVDTPGFYEVYIEPNNGDCPIEGSAVVGIFDIPEANPTVTELVVCDDMGNDGVFQGFDFTIKNNEILGTQSPAQYNVRYFESLDDANNLNNEITIPYTNISNPQTIYARVDNIDNTNCFEVTSFAIRVSNTPQIAALNNIEFCDNQGDPTDGFATIDLNDLIPTIRGTQEEADTNITFHPTQQDADDNTASLPLVYTNTTALSETIFVRIENTNNTDCFSTSSFQLIINDAPIANDISIIQCDEDGIPEGFTTFNISSFDDDIVNNETNRSITYHLSQIDAENEINAIDADAFENFFNPQVIYARVANTTTGCLSFSEVSLEVSSTSSNNASLSQCDTDGTEDGFATFDLGEANTIVLAGSPAGLNLQYYETYLDALLETNPLNATFTNTVPHNQTIYARIENANACYGISEIELNVYKLPNIETELEMLYCLNDFPETIVLDAAIINDLPNNYLFDWSTGEDTATIEVDAPGTYSVRVSNTNGCFKDRTITVLPSNIATINNIEVVDASDSNTISVLVSGEGDYEYALNDADGPYQGSNVFDGVLPGLYTVFVRDTKNDCGIVDELVSVIGFPKFFTPNGDGENEFWQVKGINNQFQASSTILIFDRYGKLLIELDPLGNGWDGTYNGAKMPTSDYWFKVQLQDGRTFMSHFSLKR